MIGWWYPVEIGCFVKWGPRRASTKCSIPFDIIFRLEIVWKLVKSSESRLGFEIVWKLVKSSESRLGLFRRGCTWAVLKQWGKQLSANDRLTKCSRTEVKTSMDYWKCDIGRMSGGEDYDGIHETTLTIFSTVTGANVSSVFAGGVRLIFKQLRSSEMQLFTDCRPYLYNFILKEIIQALWQSMIFIIGVYILQVNDV